MPISVVTVAECTDTKVSGLLSEILQTYVRALYKGHANTTHQKPLLLVLLLVVEVLGGLTRHHGGCHPHQNGAAHHHRCTVHSILPTVFNRLAP